MLNWILYGESFVWKKIITGLGFLLILCGYLICKPEIKLYSDIKYKVNEQERLLSQYQNEINTPPLTIRDIPDLSWKELGWQYELAYHSEPRTAYFAGSTENCLNLLHAVLLQSYPIKGFDLTKTEHKTRLAIEL